jgi:hypothetical protein
MKGYGQAHQYPGRLIVVEGIDGSGKSTQLQLLQRWLVSQGQTVFFTEWNSSKLVKETTKLGKKSRTLTPLTFSLIHATDFADRLFYNIIPPLKAGMIVLADRYCKVGVVFAVKFKHGTKIYLRQDVSINDEKGFLEPLHETQSPSCPERTVLGYVSKLDTKVPAVTKMFRDFLRLVARRHMDSLDPRVTQLLNDNLHQGTIRYR